jgi:hypothetical protein
MTDPKKAASDFLALCTGKRERCSQALDLLVSASEGAPLYNVDFKDAKVTLSRRVEEVWKERVAQPFCWGRGETAESDLNWYLGHPRLHGATSRLKKFNKMRPESSVSKYRPTKLKDVNPEMVAAAREVLEVVAAVGELVDAVKGSVVKGRKPAKPSKAREASLAKEAAKRTCPCCFRAMALDSNGRVVRHGWREAGGRRVGEYGNTWHVGQCFGVGYEPFEVSCQGTKDFHAALLRTKAEMEKGLATLEARPAKLSGSYKKGWGRNAEKVSFELEDDGVSLEDVVGWRDSQSRECPTGTYAWNLKNRVENAKAQLRMLQHDLDHLAAAVKNWKPAAA